MHSGYTERWEVSLGDVQGRMSSIHFWPSTLTCARVKIQVLRDEVLEHQEVTPYLPVTQYEVKCNHRFAMDIPKGCTHIRMALISGDIHPISEKPKLLARSRLAFSEVRRRCPIHKYFSLYRWDPVTESNVPGGHIRVAFQCNRRTEYFDGDAMERRSTSSMDRLSLCSFGRSERLSLTQSCDSDIHALPQRPISAISRVVYCSSTQPICTSSSTCSDKENADSTRTRTERTSYSGTFRREMINPFQNPRSMSLDHHVRDHHQPSGGGVIEEENLRQYHTEETAEMSVNSKPSENENTDSNQQGGKYGTHKMPWFGVVLGTTLGVLGTVAAVSLRLFSRRKSKPRRNVIVAATAS